jgi:hypothetical protein
MNHLKLNIALILSLVIFAFGCKTKLSLSKWEGVGKGDSYLEIQDSILAFNGPDFMVAKMKVISRSQNSINCRYYDPDTGELKTSKKFSYSNNLEKISTKFDSTILTFTSINRPNLLSENNIESISYEIFGYNENLFRKYNLKKNGNIIVLDGHLHEIKNITDINTVESIFKKLSILDLDKFVWSEKNFFMISHTPCHCIEINYNQKKKLRYCRQKHNSYIKGILTDIKTKIE